MAAKPLPFHSYSDGIATTSRLINCFAEQNAPGSESPLKLVRAPGIRTFYDGGDAGFGEVAAMAAGAGYLWPAFRKAEAPYGVGLTALNSIGGAAVETGQLPGSEPVSIAIGVGYIVFVTRPKAEYIVLAAPGSPVPVASNAEITDADFTARGASEVVWLDNWFLFREPLTGRFFGADVGQPIAFDALNFATAESYPDTLIAMQPDHGQLILLGEISTEIWENTGIQGFPFQRVPNGRVEIGCGASQSKAQLDQSVAWLANDATVRSLSGVTPQRISTHPIEKHLGGDQSAALGSAYTLEGHNCYVLSVEGRTFVYDATTQLWHERQSYGEDRWLARYHTTQFGRQFCAVGSKVGYLDSTCYTECGATMVMSWTYEPITAEGKRVYHDRFELEIETGVDGTVMLELSDDGGATFQAVATRDLGAVGERTVRVFWTSLGSAYRRVYRCSVSDPCKVVVTGTWIDTREGRN